MRNNLELLGLISPYQRKNNKKKGAKLQLKEKLPRLASPRLRLFALLWPHRGLVDALSWPPRRLVLISSSSLPRRHRLARRLIRGLDVPRRRLVVASSSPRR